ncbi:MAG: hypothetical protein K2Z81_00755 [Cyanobacteria bacterium]|nr:hypothetical protein [Cyanobacteriota bacterium]
MIEPDERGQTRSSKTAVILFVLAFFVVAICSLVAMCKLFTSKQEEVPRIAKSEELSPFAATLRASFQHDPKNGWFTNGPVSIEDVRSLVERHKIGKLTFKTSEIDADSLACLKAGFIEKLTIERDHIDASAMEQISQFPHLKALRFVNDHGITDEVISKLTGPSILQRLELRFASISAKGVEHLAKTFKQLEVLDLSYCKRVDDTAVSSIRGMSTLRELVVRNTSVGDAGAIRLSQLPQLNVLILDGLDITDSAVRKFGNRVKLLGLKGTKISDAATISLAKMSKLEMVQFQDCKKITAPAVSQLQKRLPDCTIEVGLTSDVGEKYASLIKDYQGSMKSADDGYLRDREDREKLRRQLQQ